jgi:O-antigen ligase
MMKCKKENNYHDRAMIRFSRVLAGACVGLVVIILFLASLNTVYPGSIGKLSEYSLFTFSGSWGSKRGATWGATARCFAEQNFLHKLVGVGPDAMSAYMYTDGSAGLQEMLQKWFGTATLTNGHNEWLTVLADLGVLGLVSFAGIIISSVKSFVKEGRQEAVLCACGFCVLAYTVNNVFSFQQTVNGATMFVILGMGAAFQRKCRE